jgi:hypothetical protein
MLYDLGTSQGMRLCLSTPDQSQKTSELLRHE